MQRARQVIARDERDIVDKASSVLIGKSMDRAGQFNALQKMLTTGYQPPPPPLPPHT